MEQNYPEEVKSQERKWGYFIRTFLVATVCVPLLVSVSASIIIVTGVLAFNVNDKLISVPIITILTIVVSILLWSLHVKKAPLPDSFTKRFAPILAGYFFNSLLWVIMFGLSVYHVTAPLMTPVLILFAPWGLTGLILALYNLHEILPFIFTVQLITTVVTIQIASARQNKAAKPTKSLLFVSLSVLLICVITGVQVYQKPTAIATGDSLGEAVGRELNIYDYYPFTENNKFEFEKLADSPTVTFTDNYPKLDGATAAFPVYAAMAQELYKGLDETSLYDYARCSTTTEAYKRLINGEIDLFIGAQPSKQQTAAAQDSGVSFDLTPLGKEAFVFFVNSENPVDNLTIEQIQDIYQKQITNWKDVGGVDKSIIAYQRNQNSGSQTIMEAKVMAGKTMATPLHSETLISMSGPIDYTSVVEYQNSPSAIGYSFRYYVTGMNQNSNVKLLSINGVAPTVENIKNGTYPLTIDFYAVSAKPRSENTTKLVDWCLSNQGQAFIEQCGYVGIE